MGGWGHGTWSKWEIYRLPDCLRQLMKWLPWLSSRWSRLPAPNWTKARSGYMIDPGYKQWSITGRGGNEGGGAFVIRTFSTCGWESPDPWVDESLPIISSSPTPPISISNHFKWSSCLSRIWEESEPTKAKTPVFVQGETNRKCSTIQSNINPIRHVIRKPFSQWHQREGWSALFI